MSEINSVMKQNGVLEIREYKGEYANERLLEGGAHA